MIRVALAITSVVAVAIAYGTLSPPSTEASILPLTDKQIHALAFMMLVLPLGWARPDWAIWIIIGALAYGALIEILQPAVGRSGELGDLVADGVGVVLGILPGQMRRRRRHMRRSKTQKM